MWLPLVQIATAMPRRRFHHSAVAATNGKRGRAAHQPHQPMSQPKPQLLPDSPAHTSRHTPPPPPRTAPALAHGSRPCAPSTARPAPGTPSSARAGRHPRGPHQTRPARRAAPRTQRTCCCAQHYEAQRGQQAPGGLGGIDEGCRGGGGGGCGRVEYAEQFIPGGGKRRRVMTLCSWFDIVLIADSAW